jgi:hypothetical protein
MLNQDEETETKENQTGPAAKQVLPDVCPEAVLAILRARSAVDYYSDDSRFDEKFRSRNRGVHWNGLCSADVIFKLGRIIVSRKVQATLTAEEISYCLDCHRHCMCDRVAGCENAEAMVMLGLAVPSAFNLFTLARGKYQTPMEMVWVLTNRHRTRTVMRFHGEILFIKRKRERLPSIDAGQRWEEEHRRDRFGR